MRLRLVVPLAIALFAAGQPASHAEERLLDVYQRALQSDPRIREAEAIFQAELETRPQARSALLPQVTGSASRSWSDAEGSQRFLNFNPIDNELQTIETAFEQDARTTNWQIELRQTLFRWDQWINFRQSDKRIARAETEFEAAKQDLMLRVSEAYFEVLAAQDTLGAAQATQRAIERQLEQAQTRFEVGLIAITDVQEAQAAFDRSVADEIAAQRVLASAREALRELTGEHVTRLVGPRPELPLVPPSPASENAWVDTALAQNLELVATRIASEIASDDVRIRRSGHYPTLDLVASRTDNATRADRANNGGPVTPFDSNQQSDTISLQLRVPLFSGGGTSSQVREAVFRHRAAREAVDRVTRQTERQARDAYMGVVTEISRVRALEQAVTSSRTALEATETGFEVGTRTTVDVLEARRRLFDAETTFARSRYDYILNVLRLKRSSGILALQDLEEIDSWLER